MIFLQTNNDAEGVKTLPARSEIPEQMKWDLTSIFNSLEEWEQEFNDLKVELPKLIEYKGTLVESGQHLFNGLRFARYTGKTGAAICICPFKLRCGHS